MKIRLDFVTNSSSTSYIVIGDRDAIDRDTFREGMGVSEHSPLLAFYDELFDLMHDSMEPVDSPNVARYYDVTGSLTDFIREEFSEGAARRVQTALDNGGKVWIGRFGTEDGGVGSFFCSDSFEVDSPSFYINGIKRRI